MIEIEPRNLRYLKQVGRGQANKVITVDDANRACIVKAGDAADYVQSAIPGAWVEPSFTPAYKVTQDEHVNFEETISAIIANISVTRQKVLLPTLEVFKLGEGNDVASSVGYDWVAKYLTDLLSARITSSYSIIDRVGAIPVTKSIVQAIDSAKTIQEVSAVQDYHPGFWTNEGDFVAAIKVHGCPEDIKRDPSVVAVMKDLHVVSANLGAKQMQDNGFEVKNQ